MNGKFIIRSAIGGFQCFFVDELVGPKDGLEIYNYPEHQTYFLDYFRNIFNIYFHFLQFFEYVFIHSEKSRIFLILYFHSTVKYASLWWIVIDCI